MRTFPAKLASFSLALLIVLCHSCAPTEQAVTAKQVPPDTAAKPTVAEMKQPPAKPVPMEQKPKEQPVVEAPPESPNIVAKIGDYVITKEQLEKRLFRELHPRRDEYKAQAPSPDAKTVLMKIIAEKAMIMEAREQNYLKDDIISAPLKRFKENRLVNLLFKTYLEGKTTVTASEIDEMIKTNPKLDRARAKATLQRQKARKATEQLYEEIYKNRRVKKFTHNFPAVVQIHRRLLLESARNNKMAFIRIKQIKNDLTPEEKNMLLAIYDGGKTTLKDWFDTLCQSAPPSRPKDLHTVKGVERLLDAALRTPLYVAEAKSRGLDRDKTYQSQIRQQEDRRLLGAARRNKFQQIKVEPTDEQIVTYFNENKEKFAIPPTLKIDQIWCQDLQAARKAKAELNGGKDFDSIKQKYAVVERREPFNTDPSMEGIFFDDLWKGGPNEVVGPVKGFHRRTVKWRIVKILEKKPGQPREYTNKLNRRIKDTIRREKRQAIMAEYRQELLEKYPYQIYHERIADIDPLDIP